MRQILILIATGLVLGGCASSPVSPPATMALSPNDVSSINAAAGNGEEQSRIMQMLQSLKLSHYRDAVREIEAR